jgi:hypothetical protein
MTIKFQMKLKMMKIISKIQIYLLIFKRWVLKKNMQWLVIRFFVYIWHIVRDRLIKSIIRLLWNLSYCIGNVLMRLAGISEGNICLSVESVILGRMKSGARLLEMEMNILRLIIIIMIRKCFLAWIVIQVKKRKISKNFIHIIKEISLMNCTMGTKKMNKRFLPYKNKVKMN